MAALKGGVRVALVRCPECAARNRQKPFGLPAEPIHYPDMAVICGAPGCVQPGLVWLTGLEAIEYTQRARVCFSLQAGGRYVTKLTVRASSQS